MNGSATDGHRGSPKHYVKPKSPMKNSGGILSHDNVPAVNLIMSSSPVNGKLGTSRGSPGEYMNGSGGKGVNGVKSNKTISWNKEVAAEKMSFTMRREIDKAREETDLINKLRNVSRSL